MSRDEREATLDSVSRETNPLGFAPFSGSAETEARQATPGFRLSADSPAPLIQARLQQLLCVKGRPARE
jgi:hypothetical protein